MAITIHYRGGEFPFTIYQSTDNLLRKVGGLRPFVSPLVTNFSLTNAEGESFEKCLR
jgi:hypothetical protein